MQHFTLRSVMGRHAQIMTVALLPRQSAPAPPPAFGSDDPRSSIAHVLRRLTFAPTPARIDSLVDAGPEAAIEGLLESSKTDSLPAAPGFGTKDDNSALIKWWTDEMVRSERPLIERMTWFWHGHLTSSLAKAGSALMVFNQNQLIRKFALGNFRELMKAITVDAAMLLWLDGSWSTAEAPNENYARELLELFALGRGNYAEADVRNVAKGVAGWAVDNDAVVFGEDRAATTDLTIFGKTGRFDTNAVIDAVVDHPACAGFITAKIYRYFMGSEPSTDRANELATVFRESGTELRPVVENIVRHPSFLDPKNRYACIRGPVEWRAAAQITLGVTIDWNALWDFGQVPFFPPNVAGWPNDRRWLTASPMLLRARVGRDNSWDSLVVESDDFALWALHQAAIYDASTNTIDAIRGAVKRGEGRRNQASMALSLSVCSPEFLLS